MIIIKNFIKMLVLGFCIDYISKFELYLFYKYIKKDEILKNFTFSWDWYVKYSKVLAYKRLLAEIFGKLTEDIKKLTEDVEKSTEDDDISADEF